MTYSTNPLKFNAIHKMAYACYVLLLSACGGGQNESPINANKLPVVTVTTSATSGKAPLLVQLNASQSLDIDGLITRYEWDFGNGNSSSGPNAEHLYIAKGIYTITLSVTDDKGAQSTSSVTINVKAPNRPPEASFATNATSGNAPFIVSFDASSSNDMDGDIVSYQWDFGDSTSANGINTSHTYNTPGTYAITLTVTDDNGSETSTHSNITVITTSTLSGTISAALASVIDSDVNDPNTAYKSNNNNSSAQSLPNPVVVGGYLNVAQTGANGNSYLSGDTSDYFHISLIAGQSINVTIGDVTTADLDLMLYYDDDNIDPNNPDYLSSGNGTVESLTASTSGDYFIEVTAVAGYSNYTLTVGQPTASIVSGGLASTDDFVGGDVIVKFRDGFSSTLNTETASSKAKKLGLNLKHGHNKHRPSLVKLGDTQNRHNTFSALGVSLGNGKAQRKYKTNNPEKQLKFDTMQVIKALRQRADVLYAEPNYIHRKHAVPSDNFYRHQWHYPKINLPAAWDISTGSADVIVSVIDTGVLLDHPDMVGQFSADGGYDFISDNSNSGDTESGIDANPDDPGDDPTGGSSFHGTHVAGTIAAATSFSGGGIGVAGIAPGTKIMPVRVIGQLGGTSYDIFQGLRYSAGLSNDSGIILDASQRADVINLSLGRTSGFSQMEQDVYTEVRNAGVIIIAAAGNENSSTAFYPAAYSGVISVSATDYNNQKAPYSNFGSTIDVAAPGGNMSADLDNDGNVDGVLSTLAIDNSGPLSYVYAFYHGTSMAAPHVSGVIALMKSIYSDLSPVDIDSLLLNGKIVDDLGAVGRDDIYGHGFINAYDAVLEAQALAATSVESPLLAVSSSSLNFGMVETSATLTASNTGNGSLSITSVSGNQAWLSIIPITIDGTQLGTYRATVNRAGLTPGDYQAEINFVSSTNNITVPLIMQVAHTATDADAGYHYVLLIDAADNSLVDSWQGAVDGGHYQFQLNQVPFPTGREYYLIGGSDLNNNGYICEAGEACGAYIPSGNLEKIDINSNHNELSFTSRFGIEFRATSLFNILDQLPVPAR